MLRGFVVLLLLCGFASCASPKAGGHHSGEDHGDNGDHGRGGEALEDLLKAVQRSLNGSLSVEGVVGLFSKCNLSGIDFPHPAQPVNCSFADIVGQPPYSVPSIIAKLQQILNVTREQILAKAAEIYGRCKGVLSPPGGPNHDPPKPPKPPKGGRPGQGGWPGQGGRHRRSGEGIKSKMGKGSHPESPRSPGSESPQSPGSESPKSPGHEIPKGPRPANPRGQIPGSSQHGGRN
ncbi:uncharacterized protein LOC116947800 [Petromyzon marinus]|uniref:uncharacterized protein LOC116947800 n=1 Tax=Petromyzon marinus TaxID=7757 RepID=UPI003F702ACD